MTQQTLLLLKNPLNTLFLLSSILFSQGSETDSLDLDLDNVWNVEWVEVEDAPETLEFEVEYITAAAGVRGAEAEREILKYLYYRKSMKEPR